MERLFGLVRQAIGIVARFNQFAVLAVFGLVLAGLFDHALDFALVEVGRSGDGHVLFLAGCLIASGNMNDAVGVDIEGNFDLRHAARRRGDPLQPEATQAHIIGSHRAFALQDVHIHGGLVIVSGGKDLGLLDRDGGIALDQHGHHTAQGFQTQRERCHIQQEHILDFAAQHTSLDGCTNRNDFVRVDALMRFFLGDGAHQFLHHGHAGRAADQHDFIDLRSVQAGVFQRGVEGAAQPLYQFFGQLLELGARQFAHQVLGARGIGSHIRQVDLCFHHAGKFDLCLLGGFAQAL